jgi:hypothetical protein
VVEQESCHVLTFASLTFHSHRAEPYLYTFGPSDPLHVLFIITIAVVLYDLGKEILEVLSFICALV